MTSTDDSKIVIAPWDTLISTPETLELVTYMKLSDFYFFYKSSDFKEGYIVLSFANWSPCRVLSKEMTGFLAEHLPKTTAPMQRSWKLWNTTFVNEFRNAVSMIDEPDYFQYLICADNEWLEFYVQQNRKYERKFEWSKHEDISLAELMKHYQDVDRAQLIEE